MNFHGLDRLEALQEQGYVVLDDFLPADTARGLLKSARAKKDDGLFHAAGIGQGSDHQVIKKIRGDEVLWWETPLPGSSESVLSNRLDELKQAINREWFLGIWEWEGHYACYPPGAFYEKHVDPFQKDDSRILSTIYYLNAEWQPEDGGQLVIYPENQPQGLRIEPKANRLVVFFSDQLAHEVLETRRARWSVTGWFKKRKVL